MYKVIIYLIILLDISFLYILPIESISGGFIGNYQKLGVVIFTLFIFFIFSNRIFMKGKKYLFLLHIIAFLIFFSIDFILSLYKYNQSILAIVSVSNHYLAIIIYFISMLYLFKFKDVNKLYNLIINSSIILSILFILQYYIFKFSHKFILFIDKEKFLSTVRFNESRITENDFFFIFTAVLIFGILLNKFDSKRLSKKYLILAFILNFYEILIVSKSRMGLILVISCCLITVIIKYRRNKMKQYFIVLLCLLALAFIIQIPSINKIIASISMKDYSLLTRFDAIDFYVDQLIKDPFLGVGFIKPIENDWSYYYVRGKNGMFYKSDMGILGNVHTFGLLFLIWYLSLLIKIFKIILNIFKNKKENENLELFGFFFLITVGSIFINPLDPQRIVLFSILLSIFDYKNKLNSATKII